MAISPNQEQVPFTQAQADKLDTVAPNAAPAPVVATPSDAIAGTDNTKMVTPYALNSAIESAIAGIAGGTYLSGTFSNQSGFTLSSLTIVRQDVSGNLQTVDISDESQVSNILGMVVSTILNTGTGTVAFKGLIPNITTSFNIGDLLFLSPTGTLTTAAPDVNTAPFVAGNCIVQIGQITKNAQNPLNKDFLLDIQWLGVL